MGTRLLRLGIVAMALVVASGLACTTVLNIDDGDGDATTPDGASGDAGGPIDIDLDGGAGTCALSFDPPELDLGQRFVNTDVTGQVTITNHGTRPFPLVDLALTGVDAGRGFELVSPPSQPVAGNGGTAAVVIRLPPSANMLNGARPEAVLTVSKACSYAVKVSAEILASGRAFSGALDFGNVRCGSPPVTKTATVAQNTLAANTWTASGLMAPFAITTPSGSISDAQPALISVLLTPPTNVPTTPLKGRLDYTEVDGGFMHPFDVVAQPTGGYITFDEPLVTIGSSNKVVTATNAGNVPVSISLYVPPESGWGIGVNGGGLVTMFSVSNLAAGAKVPVTIGMRTALPSDTALTVTKAFNSPEPLCGAQSVSIRRQ